MSWAWSHWGWGGLWGHKSHWGQKSWKKKWHDDDRDDDHGQNDKGCGWGHKTWKKKDDDDCKPCNSDKFDKYTAKAEKYLAKAEWYEDRGWDYKASKYFKKAEKYQAKADKYACEDPNEAPVIITPDEGLTIQFGDPGAIDFLDIDAEDPDLPDDTLTFSLSGADASVFTIDPATGQISANEAAVLDAFQNGDFDFDVTVTVTDEAGATDTIDLVLELIA